MKKTIVTITGIRPDFIRMSEVFKKLDQNFNHIMIHSGQHFDHLLSDVFFEELDIREPDFNLEIGGKGREHFHQSADLSVKVIELLRSKKIDPDTIIFLGDSNSVCIAPQLRKEGYHITHIEAGMRSYDRRMLEETNRVVCDHCSDLLFVYHENYKKKLQNEGIDDKRIHVVGNTIVEVANQIKFEEPKRDSHILLDIHRPENFKDYNRLSSIFYRTNAMGDSFSCKVYALKFGRTYDAVKSFNIDTAIDIGNIEWIDLMSYKKYMEMVYHSKFIVSDSGTAQEEPALLKTFVIVPRDFTERPESMEHNCSYMVEVKERTCWWDAEIAAWDNEMFEVDPRAKIDPSWLGDGTTSQKIIDILHKEI